MLFDGKALSILILVEFYCMMIKENNAAGTFFVLVKGIVDDGLCIASKC